MYQFCKALSANKKKIVERYKPDVVISSSTYPLDSYPAYRIAKLAGASISMKFMICGHLHYMKLVG